MRRLIKYRQLTIANHFLPAIVNDDPTGLEDGDHEQLDRFLTDLEAEIASLCKELSPDKYFYYLALDDVSEDDFRRCDVTKLRSFCSPVTVLVTTHGGAAPDADQYQYTSFPN